MAEKIVIIGNGMVGHRFCETLIERGIAAANRVIVFGGEPRPAYDRVHLSSWFGEEPVDLTLQSESWYADNGIELRLGDPVTGSQRVALFGAHLEDLPKIWAKLGAVGLESGHAYAKGLWMVKSCVGDSWCRMGMEPLVDFAIELENRYKGKRSPHKLKAAVSGCTRECAEVMCTEFGLIATEQG